MKQWLERHLQTLVGSLGRLWTQPFATLLTVLVIGIALALPACLHVLVANVRAASGGWGNALDISVYMKPAATLEQARQAEKRIAQRRDVEDVTLIEADDALAEFRKDSGFGEALDALKDNPLPHALVVRPAAEFREPAMVETLSAELRKVEGVDLVQLDTAWVSRFNAILDVVRRVVLLAAGDLPGAVRETIREPYLPEQRDGPPAGFRRIHPRDQARQRHVFEDAEFRQEIVGLEDEPDGPVPECGHLVRGEMRHVPSPV